MDLLFYIQPVKPPDWVIARLDDGFLRYDYNTGELIWAKSYHKTRIGEVAGYCNKQGYVQICFKDKFYGNKTVKAHHIVWYLHYGVWPEKQIDHRDDDGTNNRIRNLRKSTLSQNGQNSKAQVNNFLGIKGVCFAPKANKYQAQIQENGKLKWLGYHSTIEEAEIVYNLAESRRGEFASLKGARRKEIR